MILYNISWLLALIFLVFLIIYNWQRRWLYYYASKIPGPFALPLIGSVMPVVRIKEDILKTIQKICKSQPPVCKLWMKGDLYVVNSEPEDIEFVLSSFLEKSPIYEALDDFVDGSLLTSPVKIWKRHRKLISQTFNPKIILSFHDTFVKYAKKLIENFDGTCGQEMTDLVTDVWKCTLGTSCETLGDLNPEFFGNFDEIMGIIIRGEQIITERYRKLWLAINFFWRFSQLRKETKHLLKTAQSYIKNIKDAKKTEMSAVENGLRASRNQIQDKYFATYLFQLAKEGKMSELQAINECLGMFIASSESSAATVSNAILILGMYPEIEDRIYQEVCLAIGNNNSDLSCADISKLEYLERVIKETLRLLPPIPLIMRSIDKDTQLKSHFIAAGSNVLVPILHLHTRPDLWPDPLKFDPDRFLPEEIAKRHPCAYIAFSHGPRNCIGIKYAMVSMKIMLAYMVKNFKFKTLNCHSVEDIDFEYHVFLKPKGYRVKFERRID